MRPSMTARGSRMAIRYHNRVSPAVDVAEARVVTFTQRRRDALRPDVRRDRQADWRIAMIDTGMWRNIGERLWAVREAVQAGTT